MKPTFAKITSQPENKLKIETRRLILRGAEGKDLKGLHACFSDIKAMRYWSSLPHKSEQETMTWINKMVQGPRNGITDFVITLKDSGECIGKVGIWAGNEIGFMLSPSNWGKGLAQEAVSSVLDLVFRRDPDIDSDVVATARLDEVFEGKYLEQVTADVDPRNEGSLKCLARLGFEVYERKERTFQIGGEWVDSVYLSLDRDVWVGGRTGSRQGR